MAGQDVKYEAMMVPIAGPLETGTGAAALHSEIHLDNKEPSSIYTQTSTSWKLGEPSPQAQSTLSYLCFVFVQK